MSNDTPRKDCVKTVGYNLHMCAACAALTKDAKNLLHEASSVKKLTHLLAGTRRQVREHKDALTKPSRFSYVAEHSKDSGHNIDWFNVKIITRDNITIKRLIKETLAISSLKPEMNAMQSSVQLNVFS